jgi:hypothetical protein
MSNDFSQQSRNQDAVPEGTEGPKYWYKRPAVWAIAFGIVAIVLIEGFALSWGGSNSTVTQNPSPRTVTTVPQPNIRLCPRTKVQLIEVDYLRYPVGNARAMVVGHAVTIHCGGLDDFHFIVHSTPATANLRPDARIVLMKFDPSPQYYVGSLEQLNNYLSSDLDGNIFIVTGPDSGATSLDAAFHP